MQDQDGQNTIKILRTYKSQRYDSSESGTENKYKAIKSISIISTLKYKQPYTF